MRVLSRSVVSDYATCGLQPARTSVLGILQTRVLERVPISLSRRSSRPRDQPASSALQVGVDLYPLSQVGIGKTIYIYSEQYSAMRKKEILPFVTT